MIIFCKIYVVYNIYISFSRTKEDVEGYRDNKEITLKGRNIPNPIRNFEEAGFPDYVTKELK